MPRAFPLADEIEALAVPAYRVDAIAALLPMQNVLTREGNPCRDTNL